MKRSISYMALALAIFVPALPKLALAQTTRVPQARTNAGPALAAGNLTFLAWKGQQATDSVFYSTFNGSTWTAQRSLSTQTEVAPALAAANGTVYLAWSTNNSIQYTNWNGTEFPASISTVPGAQTTAAPALAGNGSTLYLAYTQVNGSIVSESYVAGVWKALPTPATTFNQMAPALAAFDGSLYMAWVDANSGQLMYATLPLSGGSWSGAASIGDSSQTPTSAPTLGVFSQGAFSSENGLYVAWMSASQVNYSYNTGSGSWNPGPIPPGPLATNSTPALMPLSFACPTGEAGGTNSFYVFYTSNASTSDKEIFFKPLLPPTGKCKVICNPPCS